MVTPNQPLLLMQAVLLQCDEVTNHAKIFLNITDFLKFSGNDINDLDQYVQMRPAYINSAMFF
jgi:hypothetical protein